MSWNNCPLCNKELSFRESYRYKILECNHCYNYGIYLEHNNQITSELFYFDKVRCIRYMNFTIISFGNEQERYNNSLDIETMKSLILFR